MNLREAAAFVRVSERTLADLARRGEAPAQKAGREWRFLRPALEEWLRGGMQRPQPRLPGLPDTPPRSPARPAPAHSDEPRADAGFRDTAFAQNRQEHVHRWVPWVAGYSASFVDGILASVLGTPRETVVLDPFAGVGTTLVEAMRQGYDTVGFEINPYAALACEVKLRAAEHDVEQLRGAARRFRAFMADRVGDHDQSPASAPPPHFRSRRPFFSPDVERQVLFTLDFIAGLDDPTTANLFRVAFGAVMVSFSNYSYEPSLGTRSAAGKEDILQADVAAIIAAKMEEMASDIAQLQAQVARLGHTPRGEVHTASYLEACARVPERSVDVVITSPPYLNNYHYVRNTRPHLFWLGLVSRPSDLKALETNSFGKYWQTVRAKAPVALEPDYPELREIIAAIADTNGDRGVYGGVGWANYAATYFNDCAAFCRATLGRIKPGGLAVIVIGNNILQGIEVPTDRLLAGIAERVGFSVEGIHEVRRKRTGSSIINSSVRVGKAAARVQLYESAVALRAPV